MFKGVYTALITPFNQDESVDFGALKALVQWQVAEGVQGIIPVGTTGECPTLEMTEHLKVIEEVVAAAAGKVQIVAGTGANSTAEACELTHAVKDMGVDGTLQVTPYYNKPNSEGLFRHFAKVAEIGVPVMLYNVPGRAGKEIPLDVVVRLAGVPNVVAIKEAAGSVERANAICHACNLTVLSGDDSLALPMISVGAQGVVSVASNVIPNQMVRLVSAALAGDFVGAREIHARYYPLFRDMFIDTNPIPVKTALGLMGRIQSVFRLPLCEMNAQSLAQLKKTLTSVGVL